MKTLGLAILFLGLCSAIGCNMPVAGNYPNNLTDDELRQTLAAQSSGVVTTLLPPSTSSTDDGSQAPPFGIATVTPDDGNNVIPPGVDYSNPGEIYQYYARSGDTLEALSRRFDVDPKQIISPSAIPLENFIPPGQILKIPNTMGNTLPSELLLPDSEVIYSPSSIDFQVMEYIQEAGGFLSTYDEIVDGKIVSGIEIVERVAQESSVNPRFLLAFLDFRSNWVTGQNVDSNRIDYPIGFRVPGYKGLYLELVLTATHLNAGYYGWRSGELVWIKFPDKSTARLNPTPNAGTVAAQHLFGKFYHPDRWDEVLYGEDNFITRYTNMFGDPWERAAGVEPLFSDGISQPALELPFASGERWSMTGGPHYSWNTGSPRGALDFSPVTGEPNCAVSRVWVTASAPGIVVRSNLNVVVIDLDGDGYEQTGWTVVYVHVSDEGSISPGEQVETDDPLGHPSCERGRSTGTHVHIARKYNGEWLFADGPLPLILSGWEAQAGPRNYQGELIKNGDMVTANPGGSRTSIIVR